MSRSERQPRACEQCGETFQPAREAVFCSAKCRAAAFKDRAHEGKVTAVCRLRDGEMTVIVRMPKDIGLAPGATVQLGELP